MSYIVSTSKIHASIAELLLICLTLSVVLLTSKVHSAVSYLSILRKSIFATRNLMLFENHFSTSVFNAKI